MRKTNLNFKKTEEKKTQQNVVVHASQNNEN